MNEALLQELTSVGANSTSIRWLEEPSPDVIDYLDLVQPPEGSLRLKPACVVEHENQPLVYVVDISSLTAPADRQQRDAIDLLKILALRGESGYLALSKPGQLTVYPLLLAQALPQPLHADTGTGRYATLIPDLASGALPGPLEAITAEQRKARALGVATHELLFQLLTKVAHELSLCPSLSASPDDILALVGRALFARFLIDRRILTTSSIPTLKGELEDCFSTEQNAAATCAWMDDRFNGDLLPLRDEDYVRFFKSLGRDVQPVCRSLSNIMYRALGGQTDFELYWNDINFAHVPIGLLSEVYESFAHNIDAHLASAESIHYTPRRIAQLLVEEAIAGVSTCKPHQAVCLDPAAGGGVFLVLLLRRLVAERWRSTGRRPNREEIETILYHQLRGFDINISALKMAALSLYLTAIELNPHPFEIDGPPFNPLVGKPADRRVLTHLRMDSESHPNPFVPGSLGDAVPDFHRGLYDVVVGNPPWTAPKINKATPKPERDSQEKRLKILQGRYTDVVRKVAQARDPKRLTEIASKYENPDGVPDLPFVWRAMEWCKPHGVIAYTLHARLLFKRTTTGKAAQDAIFSALRVTSIVNGAALRQTDVWPNIDAPWCLLFALNELPEDTHVFYFLSPMLEMALNRQSRMRLDHASAEPIEFGVLQRESALFKTLFRGTALDVDIARRLAKLETIPLQAYWRSHGLLSGDGYQLGPGKDATQFQGKPDLRAGSQMRFAVDVNALPTFSRKTLRRTKKEGFFRSPFVLFPESLSDRDSGGVLLVLQDLLFSESHYGYSVARPVSRVKKRSAIHTEKFDQNTADSLVRYLYVIGYSSLFHYVMLMTSSKFGVERDAILKEDVDDFPLIPFEQLSSDQLQKARSLSEGIALGNTPWVEVDTFVGTLYGLSPRDMEVITDTLSVSLPFTASRLKAEAAPGETVVEAFRARLEVDLQAFVSLVESEVTVTALPSIAASWRFLKIGSPSPQRTYDSIVPKWVTYLADHQGATRVILNLEPGALVLGLLAQGRYWTQSRARLCAMDLVREFGGTLVPMAVNDA